MYNKTESLIMGGLFSLVFFFIGVIMAMYAIEFRTVYTTVGFLFISSMFMLVSWVVVRDTVKDIIKRPPLRK